MKITAKQLRQKYLDFFKGKGHTIISGASLIPENDPTTLFTGSGMQSMMPFLLGEKHPLGKKITDSQKCFRSQDIEEVGDNRHTTFFEMLGNWSLGDYFKKEQITWMLEFLTREIGLDPQKIYVTVFRGNEELNIPRDTEAVDIWKREFSKLKIEAKDIDFSERDGMQGGRIFYYDERKNWWSRAGVPGDMPIGEPGGPDSEMFWDFGADLKLHENSRFKNDVCHVNCDCGRFLEIGNNVFMTYKKTNSGFEPLPAGNIDFGGGLERMAAAVNDDPDIFKTDLFTLIVSKIEEISGKKYSDKDLAFSMRVIADHLKAAIFMLSEGLEPSNTERGYVLRRLIRRAVRYGKQLGINKSFCSEIAEVVVGIYQDIYPEVQKNIEFIKGQLDIEEKRFLKALERGLKVLHQQIKLSDYEPGKDMETQHIEMEIDGFPGFAPSGEDFTGRWAFDFYQSFGFPLEMTIEELKNRRGDYFAEKDLERLKAEFFEAYKKHQKLSRTASAGVFKGGLQDHSEISTKYHTATHLLQAALRQVLGNHVFQKGSNITNERMRFDFPHQKEITQEELKKVEDLVNQKIKEDLPVHFEEMELEKAKRVGALGVFESKYGEKVKVYFVGPLANFPQRVSGQAGQGGEKDYYSIEICGGPHVGSTGEIGGFKIQKCESIGQGVKRIRAVVV